MPQKKLPDMAKVKASIVLFEQAQRIRQEANNKEMPTAIDIARRSKTTSVKKGCPGFNYLNRHELQ